MFNLDGSVAATLPVYDSNTAINASGPDVLACPAGATCDVYTHDGTLIAKGINAGSEQAVSPDGRRWVCLEQQGNPNPTGPPTVSTVYLGGIGIADQLLVSTSEPHGVGLDLLGWATTDSVWASNRTLLIGGGASLYPHTTDNGLWRLSVTSRTLTAVSPPTSNCYPSDENQMGVITMLCVDKFNIGGVGSVVAEGPTGSLGAVAISPIRGGYGNAVLSPNGKIVVLNSEERVDSPTNTSLSASFPGGRLELFGPPGFFPLAVLADESVIVANDQLPSSPDNTSTPSAYVWMQRVAPDGSVSALPVPFESDLFFA